MDYSVQKKDVKGGLEAMRKKERFLKEKLKQIAREERAEWMKAQDDETEKFKREIAKELGIEGHPKFEILWAKAWDLGHSSGLSEIGNRRDYKIIML